MNDLFAKDKSVIERKTHTDNLIKYNTILFGLVFIYIDMGN